MNVFEFLAGAEPKRLRRAQRSSGPMGRVPHQEVGHGVGGRGADPRGPQAGPLPHQGAVGVLFVLRYLLTLRNKL